MNGDDHSFFTLSSIVYILVIVICGAKQEILCQIVFLAMYFLICLGHGSKNKKLISFYLYGYAFWNTLLLGIASFMLQYMLQQSGVY
jgi:hypothetical protein